MNRIIICCDGTWSNPDQLQDGTAAPTNVVRIAEAVASSGKGIQQVLY